MEITEPWRVFSVNVPKGQITSFGVLFFSFGFAIIAYLSPNSLSGYIFLGMSVSLYVFGILVYAGFIPCKERLLDENSSNEEKK